MKKIIGGMFLLAFISAGFASVAGADILMPFNLPESAYGNLNSYYIGMHRPDGSCVTLEVLARTEDEAKKVVREQRCGDCMLENMTPAFSSGDPDFMSAATQRCPMR